MTARRVRKIRSYFPLTLICVGVMICILLALIWKVQAGPFLSRNQRPFPVTVDPKNKIINESRLVNNFLAKEHDLFRITEPTEENKIKKIFEGLVIAIADGPTHENLANAGGAFVTITPGMRKEQVVLAFSKALNWNSEQRRLFITPRKGALLPLSEGSFAPGMYLVTKDMTAYDAQTMVNERFTKDVLSRYSTSTQEIVPLKDALIIASLIQRETIDTDGMRLISGIVWNRIFINMNLQIDSTLQYAKANRPAEEKWWPRVASADKYIASSYNTYMHNGLPPAPIANPSVEAILAALNPIETPCLFYFNDPEGNFHCSVTYEEHRDLIKEYY